MRLTSSNQLFTHAPQPPLFSIQPERRSRQEWQLDVSWATSEEQVRQAQRLRYRVFALEMGARLAPPPGTAPGLDADRFDPFCDHLMVHAWQRGRRAQTTLVGTYRLLSPAAAARAGGLYMDTEFDLGPLASLRAGAVELGRSCVDPDWRGGAVIMALWTALGEYMRTHGSQTMIGCASIPLGSDGTGAAGLWEHLRHTHLAPPQWQVTPSIALPLDHAPARPVTCDLPRAVAPPLIKGYLRCGARLLGPPALDVDFHTADLPMMLRVADLAPRYRRHFLDL